MAVQDVLDRLRQPEYTGENRCVPCTIVNVAIAVVLALAVQVAVLLTDGSALAAALASASVLVLALAAVSLRGYLVPGTPWLTRTYFPAWVLRRFDKAPDDSSVWSPPGDGDTADDEFSGAGVETTLARTGAVTDCEDTDDLCLTDEFQTAWHERIATRRERDNAELATDLAPVLDVDADEVSIDEYGNAWTARVDGRRVGQWESRAAVLADAAAASELRERSPEAWGSLSVTQRGQLLQGLRVFVERCPACDGAVELGEETVSSCCRTVEVVAVTCRDCGARLFETERPSSGDGPQAA